MTHDVHVLMAWIFVCLVVAALCTTAFPVLYAFFPWRSSLLGKLFMLQAVAFALAMDGTVIFNVWRPDNVMLLFWANVVIFTLIAISTAWLTGVLWKANHTNRKVKKEEKNG